MVLKAATMSDWNPSLTQDGQIAGPPCTCGRFDSVRGWGDPSHGVVLVGIAPGSNEMRKGRPFVGASGQLMDSLLRMCDWPRERTYATNLICWLNNSPDEKEIAACGERFTSELTALQPRLIISLGQIVTSRLTGLPRGTKNILGSVLWSDEFKCYVLTTRHPAGPLYAQSMSMVQDLVRDFDKIPMILEWPRDGSIADFQYETVVTPEAAQAVLDSLPTDRNVVVDIETNSKTTDETDVDVFTEELLRIGFRWQPDSGPERVYTFRPSAWRDVQLRWPSNVRWEFQFGVYDTMGLWRHLGCRLKIVEDLGLKSYAVDERPGHHGLKTLAREYQGAGWYDAPLEEYKKKGTMHLLDDPNIASRVMTDATLLRNAHPVNGELNIVDAYNAADVVYTGRTDPIIHQRMLNEGTDHLYYDLLIPAYNVYRDSQYRGINVDHRRLIELGWESWMPRWIEMEETLQDEAAGYGFQGRLNLNSPQQIAKLFFSIIGLDVVKYTPKGAPSTDKEVMDALDHPFAAKIRAFRALDGMMDYVFAIQNEIKLDGKIHPSAQLHTTRTGRRSYKRPAMQTIPEEYTVGAEFAQIQEVFVPHDSTTHGMLKVDYEQIEVWMGWVFSRDPVLLEHLLSGDVHSATAEIAFKISRHDFGYPLHKKNPQWNIKRQGAKKLRFGLMYGEGAKKLASPPPVGLGSTVREAQEFIDNYWKGYATYAAWTRSVEQTAAKTGELVTPFGRKMHFPLILDHKQLRQAINFPVQSPASDHVLVSLIELAERLKPLNSYVLIDVHDALWIEYDLRFEREVTRLVREVMERPKWEGAPNIPVEIKVGPSIGQLHLIERESPWEFNGATTANAA